MCPTDAAVKVAILVGVIDPVLSRVRRQTILSVDISTIPMAKNGYRLTMPASRAVQVLEGYADKAQSYDDVAIIVTPFFRRLKELDGSVKTLSELGAHVVQMRQGTNGCPKLQKRMDAPFQTALAGAITDQIYQLWSPQAIQSSLFSESTEYQVALDLLRGLATHNKMGPNNHSHEDDMWKARGDLLKPGDRTRIVRNLMAHGILARKKNRSQGGTGWVYWIADVERTVREFPQMRNKIGSRATRGRDQHEATK